MPGADSGEGGEEGEEEDPRTVDPVAESEPADPKDVSWAGCSACGVESLRPTWEARVGVKKGASSWRNEIEKNYMCACHSGYRFFSEPAFKGNQFCTEIIGRIQLRVWEPL